MTDDLSSRAVDWYEGLLRYWQQGPHGQSERFQLGILHTLSDFQNAMLRPDIDEMNADARHDYEIDAVDWYQYMLRYWQQGLHGQSERFQLGVLHALSDFQKVVLMPDIDREHEA